MSKQAFTTIFAGKVLDIKTACKISKHYNFEINKDTDHPVYWECRAQWDTGAMMSVVSSSMAALLGLKSFGRTNMSHVNGKSIVRTFFVNLLLPNKLEIQELQVLEGDMSDTDFLIGMDVISLSDFAITHNNGNTVFSFDIPSNHVTDYRLESKKT